MKRVFLSFKMDNKKQVDGVRLLAWHQHVDLDFFDESVRKPYDSEDAYYIRKRITEKIRRSSVTVCFLGENTYLSKWVNWELEKSIELGKGIVLMGLPGGPLNLQLPSAVAGRTWWLWDIKKLQSLIAETR